MDVQDSKVVSTNHYAGALAHKRAIAPKGSIANSLIELDYFTPRNLKQVGKKLEASQTNLKQSTETHV